MKYTESPMIFFTADHHFGHKNIMKYCNRPYDTVEGMDEDLIYRWNNVVRPNDIVYHLGDFCFADRDIIKYRYSLNGDKITFLGGSHDIAFPNILTIHPRGLTDEYGKQIGITLCHYAMRSWPKSHYASWHLFGHHHGRLEPYGLSFDVGVDCWNYTPVSLDQVIEKMKTLKPIVDFRKGKKNV